MLRVALCTDFPEEQWPSMDRVAAELTDQIGARSDEVTLTSACPPFRRRASAARASAARFKVDRGLNRWRDYPRHLIRIRDEFDVFHVVDHSYAHLVHHLPAGRVVVTCHDLDAFRSVLRPEDEPRPFWYRRMTTRVLDGLRRAAFITCDTAAIRAELLDHRVVEPERVAVVPIGVSRTFGPSADALADGELAGRLGPAGSRTDLLHVGSTIERKRIDVLLTVIAKVRVNHPDVRLVRVGGALTEEQQRMAETLSISDAIVSLGEVDERMLAAAYRRAALVLQPSSREGFGLPLVEAMASGAPVVASDLAALREVGGAAVEYCAVGDIASWARTVTSLLDERVADPAGWQRRREAALVRARCFSWARFADSMVQIYRDIAA